jgi:hypothetical protein
MTRPSKLQKKYNKQNDDLTNEQKRKTALDKIDGLLGDVANLTKACQGSFGQVETRFEEISVQIAALAQAIGVEKVAEEALKIRRAMADAEAKEKASNVAKAIAAGQLIVSESVNETCLVQLELKKADGTAMIPACDYYQFATLQDEVKAVVLGAKVGDTVTLPKDSSTATVVAVYNENPSPPAPAQE